MFAFGLGEELVDKSIGKFRMTTLNAETGDQIDHKIIKCSESDFCQEMFANHRPETLYYPEQSADNDISDFESDTSIVFENCNGYFDCASPDEIEKYLRDKTFRFPAIQSIYDSEGEKGETSLTHEVIDNLIYPNLPDFRMHMIV